MRLPGPRGDAAYEKAVPEVPTAVAQAPKGLDEIGYKRSSALKAPRGSAAEIRNRSCYTWRMHNSHQTRWAGLDRPPLELMQNTAPENQIQAAQGIMGLSAAH